VANGVTAAQSGLLFILGQRDGVLMGEAGAGARDGLMKWVYVILCVVGLILPYATVVPPALSGTAVDWVAALQAMFANPAAQFLGADLFVSVLAFWAFVYQEARTHKIKLWWVCLVANLTVGLSLAFPLFLLMREVARERAAKA